MCNAILRIRYVGGPDNLITVSLITLFNYEAHVETLNKYINDQVTHVAHQWNIKPKTSNALSPGEYSLIKQAVR